MPAEETVRSADGTPIFHRVDEPAGEAGAVVVLVHGGCEHSGRYEGLVSHLVDSGIEVHALDLRGHGRSGGKPGRLEHFSDYVADLDSVAGPLLDDPESPPLFLVGYSLGGLTSLTYALDRQDELAGVILAGPALGVGEDESRLVFAAAKTMAKLTPRLGLFRMRPEKMMSDPAKVEAYREDSLVFHGRLEARLLGEFMVAMRNAPERVGELRVPLLVLHGAADVTAHPNGSREVVDRAGSEDKALVLYDGMLHDIFNEPGSEAVFRDVSEWVLSRVPVHA